MGRRTGAILAALAVGTIGSAALVPATGAAAGGEGAVPVQVGTEAPAQFSFGISPMRLPASDPGKTELKLGVEESRSFFGDGVPPGIEEATFGLDRGISLEPGGPPVCRWPAVEGGIQIDAAGSGECSRAVVGHAEATLEFAFAETNPFKLPSKGKVYNGGTRRGATDLLVELPVSEPINDTLRLLVPVRAVGRGRIGSEATFTAPTLASGAGYFLSFNLDLQRGFRRDGDRGGYVSAECRDGKLAATLAATFTDGTRYAEESVRACSRRARP